MRTCVSKAFVAGYFILSHVDAPSFPPVIEEESVSVALATPDLSLLSLASVSSRARETCAALNMAKRTESTAAAHLKSLVGPMQDTLNQHWVDGKKKNFGFKMMMKMGWSDGQGLGKELQGCATHVTVAKKVDNAGLGSVRDETGNAGWTEASATFDSVLSKLNETYGRQEVPPKRKKKKSPREEASGCPNQGGTVSMLLRHPKLLQSKNIKKYGTKDMQAILGVKRKDGVSKFTEEISSSQSSVWSALAGSAVGCTTEGVLGVGSDSTNTDKNRRKRRKRQEGVEVKEGKEYAPSRLTVECHDGPQANVRDPGQRKKMRGRRKSGK